MDSSEKSVYWRTISENHLKVIFSPVSYRMLHVKQADIVSSLKWNPCTPVTFPNISKFDYYMSIWPSGIFPVLYF